MGLVIASAILLLVTDRLAASGWSPLVRATLVMFPAMFWAASLATALEVVRPRATPLGAPALAAVGASALVVAELLALAGPLSEAWPR